MIAKKWNYKTHKYDDYVLPQGACLVDDDLGKHINCAVCGQEIILGNSYTSLEIHTDCGLGYCVCDKCYKKETRRRDKHDRESMKFYGLNKE
jgi:hypothetical protein